MVRLYKVRVPNTYAFVASPELTMALTIAGDLCFNPLKDRSKCPRKRSHGPAIEIWSVVHFPCALINKGMFSKSCPSHAGKDGMIEAFERLGATIMANACGPCIGQWKRQTDDPTL